MASVESKRKTIVIFGATGRQGGSVVNALKDDPSYILKAVTRRPNCKTAKWLAEMGIEVVKGDLDKFDTLKPIMKGAYGCFLVTDFWDCYSQDKEFRLGENVVNLARLYGVKHVIFSGLESIKKACGMKCDHFEGKALIEEYIKEMKVPYTIIRLSQFMENFLDVYPPVKKCEKQFALNIPIGNHKMYNIPAIEIGHCVHHIFNNDDKYKNQTLSLASDYLSVQECANVMNKHLSPFTFCDGKITGEEYLKQDFRNIEDLSNMFEFIKQGGMTRDIYLTRSLDPCISDFDTWVKKHKEKLLKCLKEQ